MDDKPVSFRTLSKTAAVEQRTELESMSNGEPNTVTSTKLESLYWDEELAKMPEEWEHMDNPAWP